MTDEQLDAIEARAHVATRGTSPWYDDAVMRSTSDVPALVAEIRRLRADLAGTAPRTLRKFGTSGDVDYLRHEIVRVRQEEAFAREGAQRSAADALRAHARVDQLTDAILRMQEKCRFGCHPRRAVCSLCVIAFDALEETVEGKPVDADGDTE